MSSRLIRLTVAIAGVIAILGLSTGSAAAAGCDDSWTNGAGGVWSTGANWSNGAPPTSTESACITMPLSAPVTVTASTGVGGLTLGGSSGSDELEFTAGWTFTLGGNSTIADTGMLTNEDGTLTIDQTAGALTNHGTIIPASNGLDFVGNLTNSGDGMIASTSGGVYFAGPGTLSNTGELSLSGNAALTAPYNGGSGATIINGGTIQNTSSSNSKVGAGATLEETTGTTSGTPLQVDGGTLDLAGSGASRYVMGVQSSGTILTGTIAEAQIVTLEGSVATSGSLTNDGTITEGAGSQTLTVPSGDTLTNDGLIDVPPGFGLYMAGTLHNATSGRIALAGNTGFSATLALQGAVALVNEGTITISPGSNLTTSGSTGTFGTIDNAGGTIQNGGAVTISSGGTFIEGAGTETGNQVDVTGALRLTGSGASQFDLTGCCGGSDSVSGNIAAGQVVTVNGATNAAGSFTNRGTLFPTGAGLILPAGDTLTNDGLIASSGSLPITGNLTNAASGQITTQGPILEDGANTTIENDGTMHLICCGGVNLDGGSTSANTFLNTGTLYVGLQGAGGWGGNSSVNTSAIVASRAGDDITLDGTIVPLPFSEPPPPPHPPSSESYSITSAPGTNPPPIWSLSCDGSTAQSNWGLSCSDADGGRLIDGSNTSLDPTLTTVTGSGTQNGNGSWSSTYGQPVTVTATVSSQYGPAPTGTVTLLAQDVNTDSPNQAIPFVLGTVPLSTSGGVTSASVTTVLPPGARQLAAIYNGDANSLPSAAQFGPYITQNVAQATSTTTLELYPAAPIFGKPLALRATIKPELTGGADPTASVTFRSGSSGFVLGNAPVVTKNGTSTATLSTTALPEGATTVDAEYTGDYDYAASSSPSTNVTVNAPAAPTSVTVTGPSSVAAGSTYEATTATNGTGAISYSLAAHPGAPPGMTISPSGTVTYKVPSSGVASFSYVVVAQNAAGRAQSAVVTVTVT